MDEQWLEIPGEDSSAQEIMRRVRARIASSTQEKPIEDGEDLADEDPASVAHILWQEMIGPQAAHIDRDAGEQIRARHCDIVPRDYTIGWRIPILGPIHAMVRRIIHAEIRRYLMPSLEKQSAFNREVMRLLEELVQENERLRQELDALRNSREEQP